MRGAESPLMQQPDGWLPIENVCDLGPTRSLTPVLECSTRTLAKGKGRTLTVDQARHVAYLLERRVSEIWPELTPIDQDPKDIHWQERAQCRDADPDVFFPKGSGSAVASSYQYAIKRYCHKCPVVGDCLEFALLTEERQGARPAGVFGGQTPDGRLGLLKRRGEWARRNALRERDA